MQQFLPRAPRRAVSIAAAMRAGGPKQAVRVRDISARGMLVEAAAPPTRGSYVEIIGPGNSVTGKVVWAKRDRFALRTRERLDVGGAGAPGGGLAAEPTAPATMASAKRPADPAHLAERSRHLALRLQHAGFALCALLACSGLAFLAHRQLAAVSAEVMTALG